MYEQLKDFFAKAGIQYLDSLDWGYIITLMILVYLSNRLMSPTTEFHARRMTFKINSAYRVLVFGFILASLFYWFDLNKGKGDMKLMFQSMIAAFAVYAIAFKYVTKYIDKKLK